MLAEAGISLSAACFPLLAALDRLGPLRVGELAEAVGVSQPGVTRVLERLESRVVWPRIEAAVADACAGATGPLLTQLAALEEALLSSPLSLRAARASS